MSLRQLRQHVLAERPLLRKLRTAAVFLLALGATSACRSTRTVQAGPQEQPMSTTGWKKVSIGRADLLLPLDARIDWTKLKTNDIQISRAALKPGQSFVQAWNARKQLIATGKGESGGDTRIEKSYPETASEATVLYSVLRDPRVDKTLEHWQLFGDAIYIGTTVVSTVDVPLGERYLHEVFSNLEPGAVARSRDDFGVPGAIVHLASKGGEATSVEITFQVPAATPDAPIPVNLTLRSEVLTTPGNATVIRRLERTEAEARMSGVKLTRLRRGPRSISGLPGEESVDIFADAKRPEDGGFSAEWESAGVPDSGSTPETDLSAKTDTIRGVAPTILLGYWDAISSSLHYR